jgi:sulfoxide reductase heme-binding subunit YedZ
LPNTIEGLSRFFFWGLAVFPLGRLVYLGLHDDLSANPVEFVTRSLGTWTLVFLCVTLSMTPLRDLTKNAVFVRRRRLVGLTSFTYGLLHFLVWLWLDHQWVMEEMTRDIIKRPYLTFGALALFLMLPLALTSNRWSIRSLGPRWKTLHRLIYAIVTLGVLHFYFHKAGKHDFAQVYLYGGVAATLLTYRLSLIRKVFLKH